jgi:hypothetical protein
VGEVKIDIGRAFLVDPASRRAFAPVVDRAAR